MIPPRLPAAALTLSLLLLASPGQAEDLQARIRAAQQRAQSALVNIQPITESFNRGERRKHASVGSGFLVDTEGHIVTNFHVAGQASRVMVTLSNKERIEAELVGEDPLTDLAVLRIPPERVAEFGLQPLGFGSSTELRAGDFVLALGSPLALARSTTFGVVSTTDRYLPEGMSLPSGERTGDFNTWIQTDAAINPGNSGGPLIDLEGRVVGVNARSAAFADNIGFAIPESTVSRVVRDLITEGQVQRSWVGLSFQPMKDWGGLFGVEDGRGVLVASVKPGGPAALAGVRAGDVLLRWGDEPWSARFDEEIPGLYQQVADTPVGSAVSLTLLRNTEELEITLTTSATGRLQGEQFEAPRWGFTVRGITDQMVFERELDSKAGVLIEGVKVGGPAHAGRLFRGGVLEAIDGEEVADLEAFRTLYEARADDAVLLRVRSFDNQRLVLVRAAEEAN